MKIVKLDDIDNRILGILQVDSTRSIQDIAHEVGLTNNPCWRRIKHLEEKGVIERRAAIVNPRVLGLGTTAFVSIRIDSHGIEWLEKFADCIASIPEIVECHRMTGDVDYLLKVLVSDLNHYDRVYQRLISGVPSLSDVSSTFSMEQLKQASVIDAHTVGD